MTGLRQAPLLGILGGMGPLATVDFLEKLTRQTRAQCDQDHVAWITVSQPGIPDRSAAIMAGNNGPWPYLVQGAAWLVAQGVQLIAVPCNTSHYWYGPMQSACPVPILHIAQATVEELHRLPPAQGATAVLATRGTLHANIYGSRLAEQGFAVLPVSEQEQASVDAIIGHVKAGRIPAARSQLRALLAQLAARGVDTVILGCTELPIAQSNRSGDVPAGMRVVDTSLALASASLRHLTNLRHQ